MLEGLVLEDSTSQLGRAALCLVNNQLKVSPRALLVPQAPLSQASLAKIQQRHKASGAPQGEGSSLPGKIPLRIQAEVYSARAQVARQLEVVSLAKGLSNSHHSSRANSSLEAFSELIVKAQAGSSVARVKAAACLASQILSSSNPLLLEDSLTRHPVLQHQALVVSSARILSNQRRLDSSARILNRQLQQQEASLAQRLRARRVADCLEQIPGLQQAASLAAITPNQSRILPAYSVNNLTLNLRQASSGRRLSQLVGCSGKAQPLQARSHHLKGSLEPKALQAVVSLEISQPNNLIK